MAPQMTVRMDPEIKKRFSKLVRAEGKTPRHALRELIENYIEERDTRTYIDDLWTRIGGKLRSKDLKQREIDRVSRRQERLDDSEKIRNPFRTIFY